MRTNFVLFGPAHISILAVIVAAPLVFAWICRRNAKLASPICYALGLFLLFNEVLWYVIKFSNEGNRFPEGLPLQLCDLTLWLTVVSALFRHQSSFELAYFAGIGGAGMALITPDLWERFPSYPTVYFFLAHGTLVITLVTLLLTGILSPKPGCLRRSFVLLNAYALLVGGFNFIYGTNYMFLRVKPASASLLDFFGPWPVYILVGELFALCMFWLMWLPFRREIVRAQSRP